MIKKIPFLFMLAIAFASCESKSVDDEVFNAENEKPEIIDVIQDDSHGLGS